MIRLLAEPFDPHALLKAFTERRAGAGAVASFIGLVRPAGGVRAIRLDHHPILTERTIADTVERARGRFALIDALVAHRVGEVSAGAAVVLVAAAALHRRGAFEACDFLMDYLKTEAPFWKKELAQSGERWIEPAPRDYTDAARWADVSGATGAAARAAE